MEFVELPDTDSPDVMTQAVSVYLTQVIWEQFSRHMDPDTMDDQLLSVYSKVYETVSKTHGSA